MNPLVSQIVVQTSTCFEPFLPHKVTANTQCLKRWSADSPACARTVILECRSRTSHPSLQAYLLVVMQYNEPCLSRNEVRWRGIRVPMVCLQVSSRSAFLSPSLSEVTPALTLPRFVYVTEWWEGLGPRREVNGYPSVPLPVRSYNLKIRFESDEKLCRNGSSGTLSLSDPLNSFHSSFNRY